MPAGLHPLAPALPELHERINGWYARHSRPLPWRDVDATPWGVFLSEVMAQQTPVARVEPVWHEWLSRWPTPAALAAASPGDAVRAWGRLGYPRRALRLREAAVAMVDRHEGRVPARVEDLLALPGVGAYTAAAVACFAFGEPTVVVDTNVRRVLARILLGEEHAAPALNRAEARLAADALPAVPARTTEAVVWNVAVMELGAVVCTARAPACDRCPVRELCAWQRAGRPAYQGERRRGQSWEGTDRQARGALLAALRTSAEPVSGAVLALAWPADQQRIRCLDSLVADGLVEPLADARYRLPA